MPSRGRRMVGDEKYRMVGDEKYRMVGDEKYSVRICRLLLEALTVVA